MIRANIQEIREALEAADLYGLDPVYSILQSALKNIKDHANSGVDEPYKSEILIYVEEGSILLNEVYEASKRNAIDRTIW